MAGHEIKGRTGHSIDWEPTRLGTVLTGSQQDWAQYWLGANKTGHSIDKEPVGFGTVLTKTGHSTDQEPMIRGTVLTKSQ